LVVLELLVDQPTTMASRRGTGTSGGGRRGGGGGGGASSSDERYGSVSSSSVPPSAAAIKARQDAKVAQLVSLIGGEAEAAANLLEAFNWDVEIAASTYFESGGLGGGSGSGGAGPGRSGGASSSHVGGSLSAGDDYDEDAALAAVLAESEDGVRAGDAARVERLADAGFGAVGLGLGGAGGPAPVAPKVHSAFRDFKAERDDMRGKRAGGRGGKSLAAILRPPTEIIFPGDFDQVRCMCGVDGVGC